MKFALLILAAVAYGPPATREDARSLLERVVENQERNQALQRQFAYVERMTTEHLRTDAPVSKRKAETFEVTPAPGGEYRRLIAKNGRALTPKEEAEEEKKFQRYLAKQLELSPDKLKSKENNLKTRLGRFESRIREALEVFEFTASPDETLSGRPVRVFQFSPKAGYGPHSRATNLLSRTEGTIWIDSQRNQIAKLQMRFRRDMKFLAGIFGRISKGTHAVAVMKPIGDEVWLLDTIELVLKGRFYFLKRYNRRLTFTYTDYRKYTVSTEETVGSSEP
jgi:hypothetical protein